MPTPQRNPVQTQAVAAAGDAVAAVAQFPTLASTSARR